VRERKIERERERERDRDRDRERQKERKRGYPELQVDDTHQHHGVV
jgi:hypothetical protein